MGIVAAKAFIVTLAIVSGMATHDTRAFINMVDHALSSTPLTATPLGKFAPQKAPQSINLLSALDSTGCDW
jgi:hypothetical protein